MANGPSKWYFARQWLFKDFPGSTSQNLENFSNKYEI